MQGEEFIRLFFSNLHITFFELQLLVLAGLKELILYRKIPKISPEAYIFQRPFLRGLFLEALIFGGAYLRREICVSQSIGLALQLEGAEIC